MSPMIIEGEILIFVGGVRKIIDNNNVIFHFYVTCIDCFVKKKLCSF